MERLAAGVNADQVLIPKVTAGDVTFDAIVGLVYTFTAAIALFFIIRAGLLFVTSGDDPSSVKAARETILYAVIGLVGSTLVFIVVNFVIGSI